MAFSLRYTLTFPCKSLRFQHNKFLQSDCILNFSNLITIFPVIANFYIFIFTLYFLSLVTRFSLYAKRCHKYFFGCLYCPKKCPLVSFAPFLLMDNFLGLPVELNENVGTTLLTDSVIIQNSHKLKLLQQEVEEGRLLMEHSILLIQ